MSKFIPPLAVQIAANWIMEHPADFNTRQLCDAYTWLMVAESRDSARRRQRLEQRLLAAMEHEGALA